MPWIPVFGNRHNSLVVSILRVNADQAFQRFGLVAIKTSRLARIMFDVVEMPLSVTVHAGSHTDRLVISRHDVAVAKQFEREPLIFGPRSLRTALQKRTD